MKLICIVFSPGGKSVEVVEEVTGRWGVVFRVYRSQDQNGLWYMQSTDMSVAFAVAKWEAVKAARRYVHTFVPMNFSNN